MIKIKSETKEKIKGALIASGVWLVINDSSGLVTLLQINNSKIVLGMIAIAIGIFWR